LESLATQEVKLKLIDSLSLSGLFNIKNKEINKIHFQDKEIFKKYDSNFNIKELNKKLLSLCKKDFIRSLI
jgi:hypothetical protein